MSDETQVVRYASAPDHASCHPRRGSVLDSPQSAVRAALSGLAAARTLPRHLPERSDRVAEAWGALANAHRVAEDSAAAHRAWRQVHRTLRPGAGNRALQARLLRLEGALFRDLRNFTAARQTLRKAIRCCQLAGDLRQEGRCCIALSRVFEVEGLRQAALKELLAGLSKLDPRQDTEACFFAFHSAVIYLLDLGRPHQAALVLELLEDYYPLFGGELLQLRACWLKGRVLAGLKRWEGAEALLERARQGFIAQGLPYDASLAGLDLALVWLEQGKTWEVADLARAMYAVFSAKEIPREASAALLLFADAAKNVIKDADAVRLLARSAASACCRARA